MKKLIIVFLNLLFIYSCKAPDPAKESPRLPTVLSEDIVILSENEVHNLSLVTKMPDPEFQTDRLNPERYSPGDLHFLCQENCPKFVTVDEKTGDVSLSPSNEDAGIYKIKFIVKSEIYQSEKDIFFLIKDIDRTPSFTDIPSIKIKEGESLDHILAAVDPDLDKVLYRCKYCLENMYVVESHLQYQPGFDDAGSKKITIEALSRPETRNIAYFPPKDASLIGKAKNLLVKYSPDFALSILLKNNMMLSDSSFFDENLIIDRNTFKYYSFDLNIEVENVDRAPVFENSFSENIAIFEGQTNRINLKVRDPDGDNFELICVDCPEGLYLDNYDVVYTPSYDVAEAMGHKTVAAKIRTYNINKELLTSEISITYIVGDTNRPPYFYDKQIINAMEGEDSKYFLKAKDDDIGDILKYNKKSSKVCDTTASNEIKSSDQNFCDCYVTIEPNTGEVRVSKPPFNIAKKSDPNSSKSRFCEFEIKDKYGEIKSEKYEISIKNKNVAPVINNLKIILPKSKPEVINQAVAIAENINQIDTTIVGGARFVGEFNITDEDPEDIGKIKISCLSGMDGALCPKDLIMGTLSNNYDKVISPVGNKIKWTPPYNPSDIPADYNAKIKVTDPDGGESITTVRFSVIKRDLPPMFVEMSGAIFTEGENPNCPIVTFNEEDFSHIYTDSLANPTKNCYPILASDPENDPMYFSIVSISKDGTEIPVNNTGGGNTLKATEIADDWIEICGIEDGVTRHSFCSTNLFENETIKINKKNGLLTFRPSFSVSKLSEEKVIKFNIKATSKALVENSTEYSAFKTIDVKVRNFNNKVVVESVTPSIAAVNVKENLGAAKDSEVKDPVPSFDVKVSDIDNDSIYFGCEYIPEGKSIPEKCPEFIKLEFRDSLANHTMENGHGIINIIPMFNVLTYDKLKSLDKIDDFTFNNIKLYAYDTITDKVYINNNPFSITIKNTNRSPNIVDNLKLEDFKVMPEDGGKIPDIINGQIHVCENGQIFDRDNLGNIKVPFKCKDGNPAAPLVYNTLKAEDLDLNETDEITFGCELEGYSSCEEAGLKIDSKTAKIEYLVANYNLVNSTDKQKEFIFKIYVKDPLGAKSYFTDFKPIVVNTNRFPKLTIARSYLGEGSYDNEKESFFPLCGNGEKLKKDGDNIVYPYKCETAALNERELSEKIYTLCEKGHSKVDGLCDESTEKAKSLYIELLIEDEDGDDIDVKITKDDGGDLPDNVYNIIDKTRVSGSPKKSSFNFVSYNEGKGIDGKTYFSKKLIYTADYDESVSNECMASDKYIYKRGQIIPENNPLENMYNTCFSNKFKIRVNDYQDSVEKRIKTLIENTDRKPKVMAKVDGSTTIEIKNDIKKIILPQILSCEGVQVPVSLGDDFGFSCSNYDKECIGSLTSLDEELKSLECEAKNDASSCGEASFCTFVGDRCKSILILDDEFKKKRARLCEAVKNKNILSYDGIGVKFEKIDDASYFLKKEKVGEEKVLSKEDYLMYVFGKKASINDFLYDEDYVLDGTDKETINLDEDKRPKYIYSENSSKNETLNMDTDGYYFKQPETAVFYKDYLSNLNGDIYFAPGWTSASPFNKGHKIILNLLSLGNEVELNYRPINIDRPVVGGEGKSNLVLREKATSSDYYLFSEYDKDTINQADSLIKCRKSDYTSTENTDTTSKNSVVEKSPMVIDCDDGLFDWTSAIDTAIALEKSLSIVSLTCLGECPGRVVYKVRNQNTPFSLDNAFKIETNYASAKKVSSYPFKFRFKIESYDTNFYKNIEGDENCTDFENKVGNDTVDLLENECDYAPLSTFTDNYILNIFNEDRAPYSTIEGYYPFKSEAIIGSALKYKVMTESDALKNTNFKTDYVVNSTTTKTIEEDGTNIILRMREPCYIDATGTEEDCYNFNQGSNDNELLSQTDSSYFTERATSYPTKIAIRITGYDVDKYESDPNNYSNSKLQDSIFNQPMSEFWKNLFTDTEEEPYFNELSVKCYDLNKNITNSPLNDGDLVSCPNLITFKKIDNQHYAIIDANSDNQILPFSGKGDKHSTAGSYYVTFNAKGCPKNPLTDWPCETNSINKVSFKLKILNMDRKPQKPRFDSVTIFNYALSGNNSIERFGYVRADSRVLGSYLNGSLTKTEDYCQQQGVSTTNYLYKDCDYNYEDAPFYFDGQNRFGKRIRNTIKNSDDALFKCSNSNYNNDTQKNIDCPGESYSYKKDNSSPSFNNSNESCSSLITSDSCNSNNSCVWEVQGTEGICINSDFNIEVTENDYIKFGFNTMKDGIKGSPGTVCPSILNRNSCNSSADNCIWNDSDNKCYNSYTIYSNLKDDDDDQVEVCFNNSFNASNTYLNTKADFGNKFVQPFKSNSTSLDRNSPIKYLPLKMRACSIPKWSGFSYSDFDVNGCTKDEYCSEPLVIKAKVINSDSKPKFSLKDYSVLKDVSGKEYAYKELSNSNSGKAFIYNDWAGLYKSPTLDFVKNFLNLLQPRDYIIKENIIYKFGDIFSLRDNDNQNSSSDDITNVKICIKPEISNYYTMYSNYGNSTVLYDSNLNNLLPEEQCFTKDNFNNLGVLFKYDFTDRTQTRDFILNYKICYTSDSANDPSSPGKDCGVENNSGLWENTYRQIKFVVYNVDRAPIVSSIVIGSNKAAPQPESEVDNNAWVKIKALSLLELKNNYCVENINNPCKITVNFYDEDIFDNEANSTGDGRNSKVHYYIDLGGNIDPTWEVDAQSTITENGINKYSITFRKIFDYNYIAHYKIFGDYWDINKDTYKQIKYVNGTGPVINFGFKVKYYYNDGFNDSTTDGAVLEEKPSGLVLLDVDRRPRNLKDIKFLYPGFNDNISSGETPIDSSIRYYLDNGIIKDRLKKSDGAFDSSLSYVNSDYTANCKDSCSSEAGYSYNQKIYNIDSQNLNTGNINQNYWVDPDGDYKYYNTMIRKKFGVILTDSFEVPNCDYLSGICSPYNVTNRILQQDYYYTVETFLFDPSDKLQSEVPFSKSNSDQADGCASKDYEGNKNNLGFFWANSCCITRGTCGVLPGLVGGGRHNYYDSQDVDGFVAYKQYGCQGNYSNFSSAQGSNNGLIVWRWNYTKHCTNTVLGECVTWEWRTDFDNSDHVKCMPSGINSWGPGKNFNTDSWTVETR